jgi:hypothetical protein
MPPSCRFYELMSRCGMTVDFLGRHIHRAP